MADFAPFDRRNYPTVGVREGYRLWQPVYETAVFDRMDLALLERLETPRWTEISAAADLGCGTGRIGTWLSGRGIAAIDGVDVTPEMLAVARGKNAYRKLIEGDLRASGLDAKAYALVACSLVDEHLPSLEPLYCEAARLLETRGRFLLVSYHPFFLMAVGMPTHFRHPDGRQISIETHLHLLSDHVAAARAAGLILEEMHEARVDEAWVARKPKWQDYRGWPISCCSLWRSAGSPA